MSKTIAVKIEKICECENPTLKYHVNQSVHAVCYCDNCGNLLTVNHKLK